MNDQFRGARSLTVAAAICFGAHTVFHDNNSASPHLHSESHHAPSEQNLTRTVYVATGSSNSIQWVSSPNGNNPLYPFELTYV